MLGRKKSKPEPSTPGRQIPRAAYSQFRAQADETVYGLAVALQLAGLIESDVPMDEVSDGMLTTAVEAAVVELKKYQVLSTLHGPLLMSEDDFEQNRQGMPL